MAIQSDKLIQTRERGNSTSLSEDDDTSKLIGPGLKSSKNFSPRSKKESGCIYDKSSDMDSGTLFLTLISQTSAHGLPRVVLAANLVSRMLWAVLFIVAICVFTFHLVNLVMQYDSHPVSIQSNTRGAKFIFPNLHICNPVTFSSSIYLRNAERDRFQHEKIKNETASVIMRGELVRDLLLLDLETLRDSRWIKDESSVAVTSLFSSANISQLRLSHLHTKEQTIIRAVLNKREISIDNFVEVPHREYLNCFKFMNPSQLRFPEDELELYLFTDSFMRSVDDIDIKSMKYKGSVEYDLSSGIVLLFSEDGSYPGSKALRLTPSAGMKTDVSVEMLERRHFNTYRRPCREEKAKIASMNRLSSSGTTVSYNVDYYECVEQNWSLAFFTFCSCIPLEMPVPPHLREADRCLNVKSWSIKRTAENIRCIFLTSRNTTIKSQIERSCQDYEPCLQREYRTQWSNSVWPAYSLISSVVQNIIKPSYEDRIHNNFSVPGWESLLTEADDSNTAIVVRDNVLKVTIRPASGMSTVWTESEAYPITYLLSDIGGILGLYLGISVLTLFEIVDIFIVLTIHCFRLVSKRHKQ